jgi:uncharacterized protein (TIGR02270 family)
VAVLAIEARDRVLLEQLVSLAESEPDARAGLESALGWVPATALRGLATELLGASSQARREIGWSACAMHGVDPGPSLAAGLGGEAGSSRAAMVALRLGRVDLLPVCQREADHENPQRRLTGAIAALFLGDRDRSVAALEQLANHPGAQQLPAALRLLMVSSPAATQALLNALSKDATQVRLLIRATGAAGDVHYVPWLIKQMSNPAVARLAAESFSMITGLDLSDFDRPRPDTSQSGPTDDPADDEVALDEDASLPWPDADRIANWWNDQGTRFTPGQRYFVGEVPTTSHCLSVLRGGLQRQRSVAAHYLCLLRPGTPLFNTAAPAWRQQRLLASMAG